MHAEREAAVAAQRPTGHALTIVRHQVVEDAFQTVNIRLRTQRGLALRPDAAFRRARPPANGSTSTAPSGRVAGPCWSNAGPDRQRSRVYAWEDAHVAPFDQTQIPFAAAQGMVDAIWQELGLRYPPRVEPMPPQARTRLADANRLTIRLPALTPSWCLLHELAHALTTTMDGQSDGHGPNFVGLYVQLLQRYLRLNEADLLRSLAKSGIAVTTNAQPAFVDGS